MAVLLIAKHDNRELDDAVAKSVTAAKKMGGDIHVLCAGKDCPAAAEASPHGRPESPSRSGPAWPGGDGIAAGVAG